MIVHGADAGFVDLGDEPPLLIGEDEPAEHVPPPRAVSWRWLTGTVLTGVTSIGLMGAALTAALNSPYQFAASPEAFAATPPDTEGIVFGRKGDRIQPLEEQVASRQVIQVSTVTRQGERDFIKLRPFAKVQATLAGGDDETVAKVPPFDVAHIFADTSAPEPTAPTTPASDAIAAADDQIYGSNVDGEVAVKVTAFPVDDPDLEPAADMTTPEVEQIVRTAARFAVAEPADVAALSFVDPARFDDAAGEDNPFSALGVRIVPENVSNVAKSDTTFTPGHDFGEKIITVVEDGDLRALFAANDVTGSDADEIVDALSQLVDVDHLHAGQKLRVDFAIDEPDREILRPVRASIYEDGVHQATVARTDNDAFVRADEPTFALADLAEVQSQAPAAGGLPRLYEAVYQTALDQHIPPPLIEQLIRIFAFDVDFQARITPGDSLEVFHSLPDPDDPDVSEPEVLYASLTLNGLAKRFYRFRTSDDGVVDYYDEEGKSAKKFLMRKPVPESRITSRFGYRRHPIVGRRILHTGVDYAAPRGTPILAAGSGIVEKAARSSGYGNLTLIKHPNGYETAYGHQNKFAKGIEPGVRVRQGQVIGYVGSTGLSTGPHLHFEIRINNKPVDPLRIRLPRGRVLQADYLAAFEHERQRIDALLGNEALPTKVAAVN